MQEQMRGDTMQILYLGRLREAFELDAETVFPPEESTVAGLLAMLRARGGVWAEELAASRSFRVAVDQTVATPEAALAADSEVAVFPPVTGG